MCQWRSADRLPPLAAFRPMKTTPREIELKFNFDHADDRRLKRYLSRAAGKQPISEMLVSVYFDTPNLQLLARGSSLRVRRSVKRYRQKITVADGRSAGLFDRAEWEQ